MTSRGPRSADGLHPKASRDPYGGFQENVSRYEASISHAIGYLQPLVNDSEDSINCPLLMPLTACKLAKQQTPIAPHRTIELAARQESIRCPSSAFQRVAAPTILDASPAFEMPSRSRQMTQESLYSHGGYPPSRARHFRLYES
jgi:hypothetical protein